MLEPKTFCLFFKTEVALKGALVWQNAELCSWSPETGVVYSLYLLKVQPHLFLCLGQTTVCYLRSNYEGLQHRCAGGGEKGSEERAHFAKTSFWWKHSEQQCWYDLEALRWAWKRFEERSGITYFLGYKPDPRVFRYSEICVNQTVGFKGWLRTSF